jgi:iron complex outermembrane receptor protein
VISEPFDRRPRVRLLAGAGVAALACAWSAAAAEPPARPASTSAKPPTVSEVVVTAEKPPLPGAVVGDIQPEISLAPEDIAAYGVSSIADLLDQLAPQLRSDRGRGGEGPVILLNGHRISGFQEIRDIPPEAILRADLLPEEAALKYGYSANQRVINIVLKPTFRSETAELSGGAPTAGGADSEAGELGVTRVIDSNPLNFDLKYSRSSSITEAERDLTSLTAGQPFGLLGNVRSPVAGGEIDPALSAIAGQTVTVAGVPAAAAGRAPTLADFAATAGVPDPTDVRQFRTLVPDTQRVAANAVYSRNIFGNVKATVNATFEASTSDSLRGLPGISVIVPAGDPFSPFGRDVREDRFISGFGGLRSSSTRTSPAESGGCRSPAPTTTPSTTTRPTRASTPPRCRPPSPPARPGSIPSGRCPRTCCSNARRTPATRPATAATSSSWPPVRSSRSPPDRCAPA